MLVPSLWTRSHSALRSRACSWRNIWWKCQSWSGPSWHAAGAHLASNGARSLRGGEGGATGGWLAVATSSGIPWMGSPPAQGGIQILGLAEEVVDVFVNMQRKLQQSLTIESGMCSVSVHRHSVGHSCYATEKGTHSANCAEDVRLHRCSAWDRLLTRPSLCNDRCRWVVLRFSSSSDCANTQFGNRDRYSQCKLCS